jgi:hypothetical protein
LLNKAVFYMIAAVAAVTLASCSEKLDSGNACPLLCPEAATHLRDTTIDAVVADTTVSGLPPIGNENFLLLASRGDTLDTRVIIRYDTLSPNFTAGDGSDSAITRVDSAFLKAVLLVPDSLHRPKAPVTITLYDVNTDATDTVAAVLAPLFSPGRVLGFKVFPAESLYDTLRIPISNDTVLDRISKGTPLRVGLRLTSTAAAQLRLQSTQIGSGVTLNFRVSPDTAVARVTVTPISHTPTEFFVRNALADYTIVVKGATEGSPDVLSVGGLPSRRTLLRFQIPSAIVDSSTIVRATILLTQRPNRTAVDGGDTVSVLPAAILAGAAITDPVGQLTFLSNPGALGLLGTRIVPSDSGVRSIEIVNLARTWRGLDSTMNPQAVALRGSDEGSLPAQVDFFSTRAPASVRPRLRITYVPLTAFGAP